ncbi:hypothetical protein M6B38_226780 [Iris pallida]|uniref:Uncharacterized protein n=1 Tax=Iris pallida TaxID=29817 RepID=A0AAX6DUU5_IRIPA|nr:hypothetical protein M6B38_226780 [Iris pallida]
MDKKKMTKKRTSPWPALNGMLQAPLRQGHTLGSLQGGGSEDRGGARFSDCRELLTASTESAAAHLEVAARW